MAIYSANGTPLEAFYKSDGTRLFSAYDKNGNIIASNINYDDYVISDYCNVSLSPMQGFDIHNGVIFQFMANSSTNNLMCTVNAATSAILQNNIAATSDHGDSASFSSEFVDNDEFPLLYVTSDTNPAKVYINRVTTTTSTLIKTLAFPLDKTGYYAAAALDATRNILYMVGYSEQNYQSADDGANKTVISKWDMTRLADNGDNTYTPAFVSAIERPFIYVMQGQQYHDGMIWIASGATNVHGYVYALDPLDGTLLHTIDTDATTEIEGVAFISNTEMVFGLQGGTYKKVTFATR